MPLRSRNIFYCIRKNACDMMRILFQFLQAFSSLWAFLSWLQIICEIGNRFIYQKRWQPIPVKSHKRLGILRFRFYFNISMRWKFFFIFFYFDIHKSISFSRVICVWKQKAIYIHQNEWNATNKAVIQFEFNETSSIHQALKIIENHGEVFIFSRLFCTRHKNWLETD